jgi:hypothetical protein
MPTLEELFNSKNQSLSSFSPSMEEDESIVEESSLTPEELTAAAALGVNTKRLSQKAYKELKTKAENIVKGSSIKPEQTTRELVKGMVKGGGTKSAEVSAKQFVKAQPSLGFPTKDVAEAVGDAIPSGVLKETEKTAIQRSPFLSRILSSAGSAAGKNALRGMLSTGAGTALGLLDPTEAAASSEFPYGAGAKKVVTGMDDYEDEATSKTKPIQRASSNVDSVEQIRGDVQSQPMTPKYIGAYTEMLNQRSKFLDNLNTEQIWQGNTSRPLTDEEKEERYARYEAGLLGEENLAKRASSMVEQNETQKKELEGQLAQIESQINASTNPFVVQRLNKEKNKLFAALSGLNLSSSEESSKTPASPTQGPSEFVQELMSQPFAQMPQPSAVVQPQPSKVESLKPTKRAISAGETTAAQVTKEARQEELTKIIGEQAAKEVAEEDFLAKFKDAQERERLAKIGIQLGKIGERFGSAVGMVKPGDQSAYDSMMQMAGGISKGVKDEQEVKKEAEENDPNSEISQEYQKLAKMLNIKITGKETARVLKEKLPMLERFRTAEENRASRLEASKFRSELINLEKEKVRQEKTRERFKKLYESMDPTKARSGQFGEQYKIVAQADRLGGLIDKTSYGMNLSGPEMEELAIGTARLLSGAGASSRAQVEALVPHTVKGKFNDIVSWLTNKPMGRDQQEFVKRTKGLLEREKTLAQDKLETIMRQRARAEGDLKEIDPEAYQKAIDSSIESYVGNRSSQAVSTKKNPKIEAAAKETGISYEKMEQYLRQTGQIK